MVCIPISWRIFLRLLWLTVKGFSIVSEAEVDFFFNFLASSMIQQILAIWSLVLLSFLNPAWTSASSLFMLKPILENFEHYVASMWDWWNCAVVWTLLGVVFLWDWNENWPFPVLRPLLSFPSLLTYWVQHIHSIILASSFQAWAGETPTQALKPRPNITAD